MMYFLCLCVQSALEVYKEMVLVYLEEGRRQVNARCADLEPWQIIGAAVITTLGAVWMKGFLFQKESNASHMACGRGGGSVLLLDISSSLLTSGPTSAYLLYLKMQPVNCCSIELKYP